MMDSLYNYQMKYKIKILKDTPFDLTDTEMSINEFRMKYGYICSNDVSDDDLIDYLETYKSYPALSQTTRYIVADWFGVVKMPENNFRVGDWVWHENLQRAFLVMIHIVGKEWKPNYVSFEAADKFVNTYKRKATQEEIDYNDLVYYADKTVLIGQYTCYYYNNVWKELIGVSRLVNQYMQASKNLSQISSLVNTTSEIEHTYDTSLFGVKVGCTHVSHEEMILIAKQLKLIP